MIKTKQSNGFVVIAWQWWMEEISYPSTETSTEAIFQVMPQAILRDEEIKGLKTEDQRMAEIVKKKRRK